MSGIGVCLSTGKVSMWPVIGWPFRQSLSLYFLWMKAVDRPSPETWPPAAASPSALAVPAIVRWQPGLTAKMATVCAEAVVSVVGHTLD